MRFKIIPILFLVTVIFNQICFAGSMPRYDVAAHCTEVSEVGGGGSSMIYNGCIEMEQQEYNTLKSYWHNVPSRIQNHCDEVARVTGTGSYSILKGCVEMEQDAIKNKKSFEF